MRLLLAGSLVLLLPAMALAQAQAAGQVLTVGFNNIYRPDCWTPMLIQLQSKTQSSVAYKIQIQQEDLDRDLVRYTQADKTFLTLGGNKEGGGPTTDEFWVYFRPKPCDDGLPDARTDSSVTLNTLSGQLKVFLCDKNGKQLSPLELTGTIDNADPVRGLGDSSRSRKLILCVTDGTDRPLMPFDAEQDRGLRGVLQDVELVPVSPRDLPPNAIGYEAVDAILWMDADANELSSGTRTQVLVAIEQWVRQGGQLVICQPAEAAKIRPWAEADLLPVGGQINGQWTIPMVDRQDLDNLRRAAEPAAPEEDLWPSDLGTPFKVARVPALPGSKVDDWIEWKDAAGTSFTPWLARRGVGLGAVTWVAQDLGNAVLTGKTQKYPTGWRHVWDRVFDWNNPPVVSKAPPDGRNDPWVPAGEHDLGQDLEIHGMDLSNTAMALLALAILGIVAYGAVAGPLMYLFLLAKKKAHWSWFMFGASAVVTSVLAALLVKLVVRGPPELHHASFVRCAAGQDGIGIIDSRFGLYIRQDGPQEIALGGGANKDLSYITPFGIHPQYANNSEALPAYQEYQIPAPPFDAGPVAVTIPYRSTSKKLQVHWVGPVQGAIEVPQGMPGLKIDADRHLAGTLINHTGYDLWHVFLIFKLDRDMIIYVDNWPKDQPLPLDKLMATENQMRLEGDHQWRPMGADTVFGEIGNSNDAATTWATFWRQRNNNADDALVMMTDFDHLPPWKGSDNSSRYELYNRGVRSLDLSGAVSAGELVICAQATVDQDPEKTPLPVPLTVDDSPVTGSGTTIWQFVLPLDRSQISGPPTTQPNE